MDIAISPSWRARDVMLVVSGCLAYTAILGHWLTRLCGFVAGPIMEYFFDGVERNLGNQGHLLSHTGSHTHLFCSYFTGQKKIQALSKFKGTRK